VQLYTFLAGSLYNLERFKAWFSYAADTPRTWDTDRYGICEHLSPNHSVPVIDRRLACEVELSSTSQASWRLSGIVGDENILCEHHLDYLRTQRMA